MRNEKDWEGIAITELEPSTKIIKVWQIQPNPYDSSADFCLCRPYREAMWIAKLAIEREMDSAELKILELDGIVVKVKVIEMPKFAYDLYPMTRIDRKHGPQTD